MSNHYFQFKQFTIHQDKCAMKVSTDACIQGAWTPIADDVVDVLDIGTGTGLLSLMLAQRNSSIHIDAIELDADAAIQAKENVSASPWADRVQIIQGDITTHQFTKQYDMVICNPPFFNNSLLGDDAQRNSVRHTISLSYDALLAVLQNVLKHTGYAAILLPAAEHDVWQNLLLKNGWGITRLLQVHPKETGGYNRVISLCSKQSMVEAEIEKLQIYKLGGGYTEAFTQLLQPFYLKL
ncbi:MAG: tRNA1(Val) (adenine(37)-N6)-methyltransferase [Flavipsychrobacter sp.]